MYWCEGKKRKFFSAVYNYNSCDGGMLGQIELDGRAEPDGRQ